MGIIVGAGQTVFEITRMVFSLVNYVVSKSRRILDLCYIQLWQSIFTWTGISNVCA